MAPAVLDASATAACLRWPALLTALRRAAAEYARGDLVAPERLVTPLPGGRLLSMPAAAPDLAVHKLISVCPGNRERGLPTIVGQMTVLDAQTGEGRLLLDAPTVTARRTAGVSLLGIGALHGVPHEVTLIGTGVQARAHAEALAAIYPDAALRVVGSCVARAQAFCGSLGRQAQPVEVVPESSDVVVTLTGSREPVYTWPARPGRLIVAVGAFTPGAAEIAPQTVRGSRLWVDDPAGAPHEAGDLLRAGVDWSGVRSLAQALEQAVDRSAPHLFKTVGCAAWDLAAGRVAWEATAAGS